MNSKAHGDHTQSPGKIRQSKRISCSCSNSNTMVPTACSSSFDPESINQQIKFIKLNAINNDLNRSTNKNLTNREALIESKKQKPSIIQQKKPTENYRKLEEIEESEIRVFTGTYRIGRGRDQNRNLERIYGRLRRGALRSRGLGEKGSAFVQSRR